MKKLWSISLAIGIILSSSYIVQASTADDPIVTEPQFSRDPIRVGEESTVTVQAQSPTGSPLTYVWATISGVINGNGPTATYVAPDQYPIAGLDTITVSVRDSQGRVTTRANVIHISKKPAPGKVYFAPQTIDIPAGGTETIKIWIDTGGESVNKVDLLINYNPRIISIEDITAMPLFPNIQAKDIREGKILMIVSGPSHVGVGAIAQIKVKGLRSGQSSLEFEHLTGSINDTNLLLSSDELVDVLGQTEPANINVSQAQIEYIYEYFDEKTGEVLYTSSVPLEDKPASFLDQLIDQQEPSQPYHPDTIPDVGPGIAIVLSIASTGTYFHRRRQKDK